MAVPVQVFYSYAHADAALRDELDRHLSLLERRGVIRSWHDREITPGDEWRAAIDEHLSSADLVLLLVSSDFLASEYCFDVELKLALERRASGVAQVVAVVLRSCDLEGAPFADVQALPTGLRPVTSWPNRDEAWTDVAKGIRRAVEQLRASPAWASQPSARAARGAARSATSEAAFRDVVAGFEQGVAMALAARGVAARDRGDVERLGTSLAALPDAKRILWVDDRPENNAAERAALARLQLEVQTRRSTAEAIAALEGDDEPYDLVISDWGRAGEGRLWPAGLRLLQRMRERDLRTPVVFYYDVRPEPVEALRRSVALGAGAAGATFRPDDLLQRVLELLSDGTRGAARATSGAEPAGRSGLAAPPPPGGLEALPGEPPCTGEGTEPEQVLDQEEEERAARRSPPPRELGPLLRYLQLSFDTFAAHEERYFGALGQLLRAAGALDERTSLDRTSYQEVVRAFQRSRGLDEDGVPGQDVCWELQRGWSEDRALTIATVEADRAAGSGGYDRTWIRSDVVDAYRALLADVRAAGGILTSAGAFRALGATVTPGRSRTSMHYSGLALDLATDTGMRDPRRDPYVVTQDGRKWRVWCRSQSAPPRQLDAVTWRRGAIDVQRVTVPAFDLTAVAERYGFARIGPRSSFPADYLAAEWWHLQYELALVPWVSQFGIELLALRSVGSGASAVVYDEEHLREYDLWASSRRMFRRMKDGWW
jgi:CheY-like chemotaxis protein